MKRGHKQHSSRIQLLAHQDQTSCQLGTHSESFPSFLFFFATEHHTRGHLTTGILDLSTNRASISESSNSVDDFVGCEGLSSRLLFATDDPGDGFLVLASGSNPAPQTIAGRRFLLMELCHRICKFMINMVLIKRKTRTLKEGLL